MLHAQIAMMKGFQEMEVLDGSSLEEDEANFFAAELLLEDSEVLELLSEYSFFETAKQLYVPAALLDYKFSLLHEKGELVTTLSTDTAGKTWTEIRFPERRSWRLRRYKPF